MLAPPVAEVKVFNLMSAISVTHLEFFRTEWALQIQISLLAREELVWTDVMLFLSSDGH
jgi:hypothetical protein